MYCKLYPCDRQFSSVSLYPILKVNLFKMATIRSNIKYFGNILLFQNILFFKNINILENNKFSENIKILEKLSSLTMHVIPHFSQFRSYHFWDKCKFIFLKLSGNFKTLEILKNAVLWSLTMHVIPNFHPFPVLNF